MLLVAFGAGFTWGASILTKIGMNMGKKIAFLFPGQGAQVVGMGKDFYSHYTKARELFQQGDDILNRSLSKIIFEGPMLSLDRDPQQSGRDLSHKPRYFKVLQDQFPDLNPPLCWFKPG